MFSVRIVTTDHYQADPVPGLDVQYSDFRGSDVRKVPVVRVFGSTSAGQKTCMHIHGVFPYLYVPYDGTQPWDRYMRQFAASVDKAINVAQGNANSNFQHVYKITLVSGIPMYGYHPKEQQFLKIYFYNPNIIRKVADLLLGGAVLNKVFQPHESHIPYTLQMFIDYNLYGMNMLNVAAVKFRRKQRDINANPVEDNSPASSQNSNGSFFTSRTSLPSSQDSNQNSSISSTGSGKVWTSENIPCDLYLDSSVVRQSVCELEVDVVAADILNRLEVDANIGTNPGLAALWEDERQRRRNLGETSPNITPPQSQEHDNVVTADSDRMWMERFHQIILDQEPYMDSQSDTISESSQDDMIPESSQDDMIQPDISTQASEVELHLSQQEDSENASQDTLMMDEGSDEEPVVNVESIHRVISMSQSFSATQIGSGEVKDKSLAQILESLAAEESPESSQDAASQIAVLEEKDSILLETPTLPDENDEKVDEHETLEMSQQVWEGDDSQNENASETNEEGNKYNLEGMDETWEESQLMLRLETDSEEDDKIPQLDGTDDRKPDEPAKRRKRLGPRGPVIQRSSHQSQGDMQYMGPARGNHMLNMPYPQQQMMNQHQGYNQYQNYSEHAWNQQQHQDNSMSREWGHESSGWMRGNQNQLGQNVTSDNQYGMLSQQCMSQGALQMSPQNMHTQQHNNLSVQHRVNPEHANMSPHGSLKNQPSSNIHTSQNNMKPVYGGPQPKNSSSSWSGQGGENMQGQNQQPHAIHRMPLPSTTLHHVPHLEKQSKQSYKHLSHQSYLSTGDVESCHGNNQPLRDTLQSPHQLMQSPQEFNQSLHIHPQSPQGRIQSPQGGIQSPHENPPVHSNLTPLHKAMLPSHENLTSPHSNLASPVNVLSPSQNSYLSTPQRSLSTSSEPPHSYQYHQQFNTRTDNSHAMYQSSSSCRKKSKSSKSLDSKFQQKTNSFVSSTEKSHGTPQSPQQSFPQYPLSTSSYTSSGEIGPGQKNIRRPSQQRSSQSEIPNTLERLLSRDDSQDSTGSNTPQRCSSRGSVNSNTSGQSRIMEHSTPQNPNSAQCQDQNSSFEFMKSPEIPKNMKSPVSRESTPNKFNLSSSSQQDLFMDESVINKSPFSPLDSAKKDSNLSDASFLNEGISPFCSGSSDIVNESPRVTYLTQSDASDYQPSNSLTTLTRLESLVSNVSLEQSYGRNLEKCVKGKGSQSRKQALSSAQRSSPYASWSDSESIHCPPPETSGQQYQHSSSPIRNSGISPQDSFYRSHSADTISQSGYFFESNDFRSFQGENAMQQFPQVSHNNERIPHHMMENEMFHGYHFSENLTDLDAINKPRRVQKSWNERYQETVNSNMLSQMPDYPHQYDHFSRPELMRSMSMPVPEKKKRGRPKGFKVNKNKTNLASSMGKVKSLAYTFTFHVPTPIFKRLKLKQVCQKVNSNDNINTNDNIQIVRMHPMDARKYSLLKIGREVVKIPKLRDKIALKYLRSMRNSVQSPDELEEFTTLEDMEPGRGQEDEAENNNSNSLNDSCDKNNGEFLGVSLDEFIPQCSSDEEMKDKNNDSMENTCDGDLSDDRKKFILEHNKQVIVKSSSNAIGESEGLNSDVSKDSKEERVVDSVEKGNLENTHTEIPQNGQNRDSERTLQDSDYRSIAAITLNSIIDRVIENSVDDFRSEPSNRTTNSTNTQIGGRVNGQNQISDHHVNSVRNVLPPVCNPQQNIVQYVTSDLPVFNHHRNSLKNVFGQDGKQKHFFGNVEKNFIDTFDVLNSPHQKSKISKVDIASPFPPISDRCKYQRRRQNNFYKYNSNPFLIDPDYDDIEHIVLKDVSLTEATDGTLTPLKTRTPTSGRSPRSGFGQDQYRLFESDFVSKLGSLAADLEMSELLNEKDQSSSESNYSSYSNTSKLQNGDSHSIHKKKKGILSRLASDFNENYLGTADLNSKRKKKTKLKLSNKKEKSSKQKKREIEGIDFIIVGKFKGIKKMVVKLDRIFIEEESVNLKNLDLKFDKPQGNDMTKLKSPSYEVSNQNQINDGNIGENTRDNLNGLHSNSVTHGSKMGGEKVEDNSNGQRAGDISNGAVRSESGSDIKGSGIQSQFFSSESFWWLKPGKKVLAESDVSKELLRKNKLSLSKRKFNGSNSKLSVEVLNGKQSHQSDTGNKLELNGCKEQYNGACSPQREINHVVKENDRVDSDGMTNDPDSPVIPLISNHGNPVGNSEKCDDLEENGVENMEVGKGTPLNSENEMLPLDQDESCNDTMMNVPIVEQKLCRDNIINEGNVEQILENENSNSSKGSDIKDSISENDSDSRSSLEMMSSFTGGREQRKKRKKKKNLTRNQRLQVAFVGTKPKRRKTSNCTESKLMSSLSLLHQATLANLNEPTGSYTDDVDDYRVGYQDAMLKMSMLSPPDSEKGSNSPPQPDSPEDLEKELNLISKLRASDDNQRGKELNKLNPLESKKRHSQLYIKIEELRKKQTEELERLNKLTSSNSVQQLSGDSLYETPLSSIEAPTDCTSKSPERLLAIDEEFIHSSNTSDSEGTIQDHIHLARKICLEQNGQSMNLQEEKDLVSEARKNYQTAVVKIEKLSDAKVENYCKNARLFSVKRVKRKRSASPPDLGPPNIPDISMEYEDNSKSPPPLLSHISSRFIDMNSSNDRLELPCSLSPNKSPASSSSSSFNVVHCDTFSDISDDDMCNDTDNETTEKDDFVNSGSCSSGNSPRSISSGLSEVVLNTVVKLTGESSFNISYSEKCLNGSVQNVKDHNIVSAINNGEQSQMSGNWTKADDSSKEKSHHCQENGESIHSSEGKNSQFSGPSTSNQKLEPNEGKEKTEIRVNKFIYEPVNKPPSRKQVTDTAVGYGLHLTKNQEAFCSNGDDLPEKPRELGGRILKVQSYRVKDLTEFETSSKCDGLNSWRDLFIANDQTFFSQSDNVSLLTKISEEPSLRFAIFPDRDIVISPCKPPPSKKSVESWSRRRKLHQARKNKNKNDKLSSDDHRKITKKYEDNSSSDKNPDDMNITNQFELSCDDSFKIVKDDEESTPNLKVKIVRCKNQGNTRHDKPELHSKDSNNKSLVHSHESADNSQDRDNTSGKNSHGDRMSSQHREISGAEFNKKDVQSPNSSKDILSQTPLKDNDCNKNCDVSSMSPPPVDTSSTSPVHASSISQSLEDIEKDIISPSPPKDTLKVKFKSVVFKPWTPHRVGESGDKNLHSTPLHRDNEVKGIASIVDNSLHSTPLRKPVSKDLFDAGFTPINKDKSVSFKIEDEGQKTVPQQKSEADPGFVTPKNVPLTRRLSDTTEASLRQSLTSQMQDVSTPGNPKAGVSQIDAPTPKNPYGFKVSQLNLQDAKALHEVQNVTVLSLEVHTESRRELKPDPEFDAIVAVFFCIHNDVLPEKGKTDLTGAIIVDKESAKIQASVKVRKSQKRSHDDVDGSDDDGSVKTRLKGHTSPQPSTSAASSSNVRSPSPQPSTSHDYPAPSTNQKASGSKDSRDQGSEAVGNTLFEKSGIDSDIEITYVSDEQEMFRTVIELISEWDPDILVGYEIQMLSWGYLLQRAAHLSIDLCKKMSRIPDSKTGSHFSAEKDEWGADYSSEIHIAGRIVLNLWRLLRHEVALNVYTFENIAFHVLHQRIPYFSFKVLNSWFNHRTHLYRWRVIRHYLLRVKGIMKIIDQLDLVGRTSEFARVFGIEFYHVLSRGSQYRVESMMLRLAKPLNFIPVSPSVHQRARMKAPECIALTLEPESNFFPDPVVVLDFQSLYPSIMIAYNYCFSTCLGRVDWLSKAHEGPIDFGCTSLNISPSTLKKLKDDVTVSPNGIAFVKQHVRKGVISAMVEEILGTRIMVKKSMKDYKNDKGLHRLLDARQLGLKLIANVTYGYTGANFSGRMPCVEVADSIVRKARETLERAIKLVEDTPEWGAKVVYGDTDSLFILLKGRSKDEAFKIGYEICDAVTNMNPKPIKLKFEKVYLPCALESKKRYVGFMYETPDQKEPVYDAKGIETVRRDSCSAVSKILEKSIKILFTSRDVSQVKQYVQTQCRKLMEGKVSMQDCIFAKEYRGMSGYKPGACVPALEISKKLLRQDRRAEPRVGERVPYVIVYGTPGLPLIKLVRQPMELVLDPTLRINATYYITKQILPPLSRVFSLIGVDVFSWYNEMPKFVRIVPQAVTTQETKKGTISQYFSAVNCPVCDQQTNQNICNKCMTDPQTVAVTLNTKIRHWEKVYQDLMQVCNSCMGTQDEKQPCTSLDCPIFFRRVVANLDVSKGTQLREVAKKTLDF